MNILVTGGAGFIGSEYVRRTLADGDSDQGSVTVTVLDKLTYAGNFANLSSVSSSTRMAFIQGDIADRGLVDSVLPGHDVVVNFAAETHVDRSIDGSSDFVLTNVVGTETLLAAALRHGVQRFVQVSTDEVYGSIGTGSWPESHALAPSSPYSASKAAADHLALSYARTFGLDVVVTRCSNNYGPFQFPEKVIPLFVTRLLRGEKVPLYGDGLNVRDWLHVSDHCRAIQLVLDGGRAGEIYNIGGGTGLTNRDLTERILNALDSDWSMVELVEDRKGHDRRYSVDITKISEELGYSPMVEFDRGLAETIDWYRRNDAWWKPLLTRSQMR